MSLNASVPTHSFGGFLGAGKTTLINCLLRQADGRRIVVFVNDFGALNIDYDLIETVETDRIALSNGCVCCSLNDDLIQSMAEFCRSDPPDAFMIEASGVANPRALDASLQALHQAGLAHLQSRVYVIDALQFGGLDYADTEDLVDHAAASDTVVLNKSDLVGDVRLSEIAELLARSAPGTEVHTTSYGQVSFETLSRSNSGSERVIDAHQSHPDKNALYDTYAFESFPPIPRHRFEELTKLLTSQCLRAKGVVFLDDAPDQATQLQLVGSSLELECLEPSRDRPSRLVTIAWANTIDKHILTELVGVEPLGSH